MDNIDGFVLLKTINGKEYQIMKKLDGFNRRVSLHPFCAEWMAEEENQQKQQQKTEVFISQWIFHFDGIQNIDFNPFIKKLNEFEKNANKELDELGNHFDPLLYSYRFIFLQEESNSDTFKYLLYIGQDINHHDVCVANNHEIFTKNYEFLLPSLASQTLAAIRWLHDKNLCHGHIDEKSIWMTPQKHFRLSDAIFMPEIIKLCEEFKMITEQLPTNIANPYQISKIAEKSQDIINIGSLINSINSSASNTVEKISDFQECLNKFIQYCKIPRSFETLFDQRFLNLGFLKNFDDKSDVLELQVSSTSKASADSNTSAGSDSSSDSEILFDPNFSNDSKSNSKTTSDLKTSSDSGVNSFSHILFSAFIKKDGDVPDSIASSDSNATSDSEASSDSDIPLYNENAIIAEFEHSELLEKFYAIRLLGKGGWGYVFAARHKADKNDYAIKLILANEDTENSLVKIINEVDILKSLNHQNVVKYHTSWLEDLPDAIIDSKKSKNGIPRMLYIQMEYCKNNNLRALIDSGNLKSNVPLIWRIFRKILNGLHYIHSNGIIHRDINPNNIFLTKIDCGNLEVKIGDFGLATLIVVTTTETGNVISPYSCYVGTSFYIAPELKIEGNYYNFKCDVFSLGIVLFMMFNCPMESDHETNDVINQFRNKSIFPEDFDQELKTADGKENLKKLLLWMININLEERPTIGQLLHHELVAFLEDELTEYQKLFDELIENPQFHQWAVQRLLSRK